MISRNVASFINELHHENVLFYSFDFDKSKPSVIQKRYLGFKEKFQGNIFERSTSSADYQSILQSVKDYLSAQPFTLIYTTADILAVKLNQIFKDISVIGIDNAEFTDFVTPKLTTVAIDQVKKGEVAIERLLESIESGTSAYYELESQLIIRDSAWINQAE
ncbi:substrate-binding domain-containing protein [Lactococcus fujiensis]|nr:substrate-binding domain-containing protein [Lactococcus fujiensis]